MYLNTYVSDLTITLKINKIKHIGNCQKKNLFSGVNLNIILEIKYETTVKVWFDTQNLQI